MNDRTPNPISLRGAYAILENIVDRAYDNKELPKVRDSVESEALFTIRDFVGELLEKVEGR